VSHAATLVARYGREPVSCYVDDRWRVLALPDGGVPYRLVGRTAITVGVPLAPPHHAREATSAFVAMCDDRGWRPVVFQAPGPVPGLASFLVAREAMLDVARFTLAGSRMANVRHTVNRARRGGVTVSWSTWSATSAAVRLRVREVSNEWAGARRQLTFTYGALDDTPGDSLLGVASDAAGSLTAFTTWRRLGHGSGLVLDLVRRRGDAEPGCTELMFTEAIDIARSDGLPWVSLGGSCASLRSPAWLGLAMRLANHWTAPSLERFKSKFDPRWENRYLALSPQRSLTVALGALAFAHVRHPAPHPMAATMSSG
jgi:lysylphosphatidylglycerol synthetase-like protein (DUF2156 family)